MIDGVYFNAPALKPDLRRQFYTMPNCRQMAFYLYKSNAIHKKSREAEAARDFFIYPADFALSRFCGKISIAVISEAGHGLLYR